MLDHDRFFSWLDTTDGTRWLKQQSTPNLHIIHQDGTRSAVGQVLRDVSSRDVYPRLQVSSTGEGVGDNKTETV